MWNRIVHPRLLAGDYADLSDFYHREVTIQQATVTQDTFGGEVLTWADLAGHVDLSCVLAPAGGREVKAPDKTYVVASHTISIGGDYPAIREKMRAEIDGIYYDILLVTHDSQSDTTHLDTQIVL